MCNLKLIFVAILRMLPFINQRLGTSCGPEDYEILTKLVALLRCARIRTTDPCAHASGASGGSDVRYIHVHVHVDVQTGSKSYR